MQRLTYVVAFPPAPPTRGGRIRVANLIRQLSKSFRIQLIFVESDSQREEESVRRTFGQCTEEIIAIPFNRKSKVFSAIFGMVSLLPYDAYCFSDRTLRSDINEYARKFRPDFLLVSRISMLQHIDATIAPVIYDQHDFSRQFWWSHARSSNIAKACWSFMNYLKVRRLEERLYGIVSLVVSNSQKEKEQTKRVFPQAATFVVNNGVDTAHYYPEHRELLVGKPIRLILLGSFDQERNIDAFWFFYNEILPRISSVARNIELVVLGRSPAKGIVKVGKYNELVTVTGAVEDERDFMGDGIMIAPFRLGAGIKHKVLIGLAMGLPVIGTSNAFQGLSVVDGVHAMICDSPEDFAERLMDLLDDTELQSALGVSGREYVVEHHSWSAVAASLAAELASLRE